METSPHPFDPTASPATARLWLSAGLPRANKVAVIVLAVFSLLVLPFLGGVGLALSHSSGALAFFGPLFMAGLAVMLVLALVWGIVRVFRSGAYLYGTELTVRGAFLSRRVDLATAQLLRMTDANTGWSSTGIPTLGAFNDMQGRSVKVHFRSARDGFLPLPEVEALASAIRAGQRTGWDAERAELVARELYLRAYGTHR